MTRPEDALERAREAAAQARARGEYPEQSDGVDAPPPATIDAETLSRWALLDLAEIEAGVYSTRRGGAPVTAFKRLLLRLLRQYNAEVLARQSRFNAAVVGRLAVLEERLKRLERR